MIDGTEDGQQQGNTATNSNPNAVDDVAASVPHDLLTLLKNGDTMLDQDDIVMALTQPDDYCHDT